MNDLAWFLASCPIADLRDATNAIVLAEKAVAATNRQEPEYLDTLAAAYAEAGDFQKAVEVQKEAIIGLRNEIRRGDFAARLKLYESDSPYRE